MYDRKCLDNLSLHEKVCAQGQLPSALTEMKIQFTVVIDLCLQLDHTVNNLLKTLLNLSPSQIVNIIYRKGIFTLKRQHLITFLD